MAGLAIQLYQECWSIRQHVDLSRSYPLMHLCDIYVFACAILGATLCFGNYACLYVCAAVFVCLIYPGIPLATAGTLGLLSQPLS